MTELGIHRSSAHYSQGHWAPAYDEKYYNNLPLHCMIFRVTMSDTAAIYKVWSADVKGLMGSGMTPDDARTDFWIHVTERIFNRIGGIYLLSEAPDTNVIHAAIETIKRDHKGGAVDVFADFVEIVIQPTTISRC